MIMSLMLITGQRDLQKCSQAWTQIEGKQGQPLRMEFRAPREPRTLRNGNDDGQVGRIHIHTHELSDGSKCLETLIGYKKPVLTYLKRTVSGRGSSLDFGVP